MNITRTIGTFAAAALLAGQAMAAQTVLSGPIRLLVPYAPGGGTDTLTRIIAPYISREFGQQVVVDNRPGGGGIIATQILARATPDGQTLSMIDTSFAVNPSLYGKLPYDTLKDFVPIVRVGTFPLVLCVHASVPAKTLKELVDLAKAGPGKLTYGSAGNGSGVHLAGEQLRVATGTNIVHVPYKGAAPQVADLLGGQVTMGLMVQSLAKPHLATGRLRALAITAERRTRALPEVMTFAESGYPTVDVAAVNGLAAPAGTPSDYVQRLNATIIRALRTQEVQDKLVELGIEAGGGSPADFAAWIREEIKKLAKVVQDANIKVE